MGKALADRGPFRDQDGRAAISHEEVERLFGIGDE
jgi:hypothetical protein